MITSKLIAMLEKRLDAIESKLDSLNEKLNAAEQNTQKTLTMEMVRACIKDDFSCTAELSEDNTIVNFNAGSQNYIIDGRPMPTYMVLYKRFRIPDDYDMDMVEKAAELATKATAMVKLDVSDRSELDLSITAADKSAEDFKENFPLYMGIFNEAERAFLEHYNNLALVNATRNSTIS